LFIDQKFTVKSNLIFIYFIYFFIINKINQEHIKVFNVYNNILFVELKKPIDFEFFGIIKKKQVSEINKISNNYYLIQTNNIFIESKIHDNFLISNEKIFYLNDGIPKRMNKINFVKQIFLESLFFDGKKNLYQNLKFKHYKNKDDIKNINNQKFTFINLNFTPPVIKEIFYITRKNTFKPKYFFKKKNKTSVLKKTINQYFYEKNISFYIKNTKKTTSSFNAKNKTLSNIQRINILKLLNNYLFILSSKKLEKRQISGYRFLDFNKKQSLFFRIQSLKTKKTFLKIITPLTHNLFKFSPQYSLLNTFFFKNIEKNALLGITRGPVWPQKNQIIENRKIVNFKNNLKFQTKKFRKIDDFSTKTTFSLFLTKNKLIESLSDKSTQQNYINFSRKLVKIDFFTKNDFHYKLKTKLNFFELNGPQKKYVENWEFISIGSWLFITKFILFISIFFILKELYKEYGKEFINYLVEYGKTTQDDFEALKEQYFSHDSAFRVIKKTKKKIRDVAGIDFILPEIGEIILNLKKATQTGQLKKTTSKGFLLSGSPGNGKTLLVQAIAGESGIPVLIQSASLLINNKIQGQSHKKLKKIFHYAKEIGPAIIFIDEIDSLGKKRNNIFNNDIINKKQFNFLNYSNYEKNRSAGNLSRKTLFINNITDEKSSNENQSRNVELNILTQFLIEMDGIQNQQKFIVFGATNRIKTLDPAFTRPGRFDRIIILDNPSKKKRLQILKFYSKKRRIEKTVSWTYLLKKTKGLTASELASIMNESTIQSILNKTTHTIETIERGLNLITTFGGSKEKSIKNIKNISYYEAGKTIGCTFLNLRNENVLLTLTLINQKKNSRSDFLSNELNFDNKTKIELENLLIYFYLGIASEFILTKGKKSLHLQSKNYSNVFLNQDDLKNVEKIALFMIDKWYLYSINILVRKENQNLLKYKTENQTKSTRLLLNQIPLNNLKNYNTYQENGIPTNWQNSVTNKTTQINKTKIDWYRLYIPDPDEKIYNIEWIPPDVFFHTNSIEKTLSNQSTISYNTLYEIERDYFFHSLILNSYNKSFFKIENNREWVDYFATLLLKYGILRENQINNLF